MTAPERRSKGLKAVQAERDYYRGLVEAFFGEDVPPPAFMVMILEQWGRKRKEAQRNVPALLKAD